MHLACPRAPLRSFTSDAPRRIVRQRRGRTGVWENMRTVTPAFDSSRFANRLITVTSHHEVNYFPVGENSVCVSNAWNLFSIFVCRAPLANPI